MNPLEPRLVVKKLFLEAGGSLDTRLCKNTRSSVAFTGAEYVVLCYCGYPQTLLRSTIHLQPCLSLPAVENFRFTFSDQEPDQMIGSCPTVPPNCSFAARQRSNFHNSPLWYDDIAIRIVAHQFPAPPQIMFYSSPKSSMSSLLDQLVSPARSKLSRAWAARSVRPGWPGGY